MASSAIFRDRLSDILKLGLSGIRSRAYLSTRNIFSCSVEKQRSILIHDQHGIISREGGLQQQLNVNVQFEPVVNCGNVVNRQALPLFMGPQAYFAGFINVHAFVIPGNSSVQACSYHARCYSSTGKVALMDKRNIRDHKRRLLAAKYEIKRVLYKAALRDPNLPRDLWVKFRTKLSKLPRNSSFTRTRNRCILTGRPRAVYRKFRMSRICFRELASKGEIMGVRKASW